MTKILHDHLTPAEAEFIATLNDKFTGFVKRGSFDPPSQVANAAGLTQTASTAARNGQGSNAHGRDDRDAIAARRSLNGLRILGTPNDGLPSDEHITGRIGGTEKIKQGVAWQDPAIGLARPKGAAITQLTTLNIPCSRPNRAFNKDHVTSFHFGYESIARTLIADETGTGKKVKPGSAAAHANYIEREAAVAQTEFETSVISSAFQAADYVERVSAQTIAEDGTPVIFTNIAGGSVGRQKYWHAVETQERKPGKDKIKMAANFDTDLWRKVLDDSECPQEFKINFGNRHAGKNTTFIAGDQGANKIIVGLLCKHDLHFDQLANGRGGGKRKRSYLAEDLKRWGCSLVDARGGRTQMRIEGELPADISHEGRIRIVKRFGDEFKNMGLPYQIVMHQPDHRNAKSNWHFHLQFHDRPVKKFTGKHADHIPHLASDASKQACGEYNIQCAALKDPEVLKQIDEFDFTVKYKRVDESRHQRISYPFAQPKDRRCNSEELPKTLRKRLAELVNDELAHAGLLRRVSPETYASLGINKTPDAHLGPVRNEFEKMGVATAPGIENERNDWQFRVSQAIAKRNQDSNDCQSKLNGFHVDLQRYFDDVEAPNFTASQMARHAAACDHFDDLNVHQRKLDFEFFLIDQTIARAKSLAEKLTVDMKKLLGAIKDGRAKKQDVEREDAFMLRLVEAETHLASVDQKFAPEIARLRQIQSEQEQIAAQIVDIEGRLEIAPIAFFAELQMDQKAHDLQSQCARLGSPIASLPSLTNLLSQDEYRKRSSQLDQMEWQLRRVRAIADEQAQREQDAVHRQPHSPNTTPATTNTVLPVPASPPAQPELSAPVAESTPPIAQKRPSPSQQPDVPVDMPDSPQNKEGPAATEASATPATAPTSSPKEPAPGIPPKLTLENRIANVVKLASENLNKNADPLPQHTKPIPPSNLEQLKTDALNRVALPQPQPKLAPESASTPATIAPKKTEDNPYADLGIRDLGNKSAMHSDPSAKHTLRSVQTPTTAPHAPVTASKQEDFSIASATVQETKISEKLQSVQSKHFRLFHIHSFIKPWYVARRDGDIEGQAAAVRAIARDAMAYEWIKLIPDSGVVPENFGPFKATGSTQAPPTIIKRHSPGIDPTRAAQYDRGPEN